jgi:hypothetical protein
LFVLWDAQNCEKVKKKFFVVIFDFTCKIDKRWCDEQNKTQPNKITNIYVYIYIYIYLQNKYIYILKKSKNPTTTTTKITWKFIKIISFIAVKLYTIRP